MGLLPGASRAARRCKAGKRGLLCVLGGAGGGKARWWDNRSALRAVSGWCRTYLRKHEIRWCQSGQPVRVLWPSLPASVECFPEHPVALIPGCSASGSSLCSWRIAGEELSVRCQPLTAILDARALKSVSSGGGGRRNGHLGCCGLLCR